MSDLLDTTVADASPASDDIAFLLSLSPEARRAHAAAGDFNRRQLMAWAAQFPEEVPLIGGELPWIAVDLE